MPPVRVSSCGRHGGVQGETDGPGDHPPVLVSASEPERLDGSQRTVLDVPASASGTGTNGPTRRSVAPMATAFGDGRGRRVDSPAVSGGG
jgi:hypothetical protein